MKTFTRAALIAASIASLAGAAGCSSSNTKTAAPTCTDGKKNGTETGTDCGGTCPATCGTGGGCSTAADCTSFVCAGGVCAAPACSDHFSNGSETGVDCGGTCPACSANWNVTAAAAFDTAMGYPALEFDTHTYSCPPYGTFHTVWGSSVYTDDSSLCTAAVHYGAITGETTQNVTIEFWPTQSSFAASDWNGVSTTSYGTWGLSFVFSGYAWKGCLNANTGSANNLVMDGPESDVDCGRKCTAKCANAKACYGSADCTSGSCDIGTLDTLGRGVCIP